MLQVCKLHDPARQGGNSNLSLSYISEHVDFGDNEDLATQLLVELNSFYEIIKTPRNRIISHNDLTTQLSDNELGGFEANLDIEYFKNLESFISYMSEVIRGRDFKFEKFVMGDMSRFLKVLEQSKSI